MDFDLNKREFRAIPGNQSVYVCGARFTLDHAMFCKRDGCIIQTHNKLRDFEAELLNRHGVL